MRLAKELPVHSLSSGVQVEQDHFHTCSLILVWLCFSITLPFHTERCWISSFCILHSSAPLLFWIQVWLLSASKPLHLCPVVLWMFKCLWPLDLFYHISELGGFDNALSFCSVYRASNALPTLEYEIRNDLNGGAQYANSFLRHCHYNFCF